MANGKVKWFDNKKGYGFITSDKDEDVFVHHSEIQGHGFKTLETGDEVSFDVTQGGKGPKAVQVRVTNKAIATR
jgi:CspA family cold shock protein